MKDIKLKENDIIRLFGKKLKVISSNVDDFDCEICSLCSKCEMLDAGDDVLCCGLFDNDGLFDNETENEKFFFFQELKSDDEKAEEIAKRRYTYLSAKDLEAEQLAFEKGLEFAIEKASEWLEKNSELYSYRELDEYDMQYYARIDKKKMIDDFKKAMEE